MMSQVPQFSLGHQCLFFTRIANSLCNYFEIKFCLVTLLTD